jgi:hypothetical protein
MLLSHKPQFLTFVALGRGKARRSSSERAILIMARPQQLRPRLSTVPFTLTVDQQDGRRFSGTLSSSRGTETVIAVISQSGTIYMVDDDGYVVATMLAPNRLEVCYLLQSSTSRIASCTEFTKQP